MITLFALIAAQWLVDLLNVRWCDPCLVWVIACSWPRKSWIDWLPPMLGAGLIAEWLRWAPLGSRAVPLLLMGAALRHIAGTWHLHHPLSKWAVTSGCALALLAVPHLARGAAAPWSALLLSALAHAAFGLLLARVQPRRSYA